MKYSASKAFSFKTAIVSILVALALVFAFVPASALGKTQSEYILTASAPSLAVSSITLDLNFSSYETVMVKNLQENDYIEAVSSNTSVVDAYAYGYDSEVELWANKQGSATITVTVFRLDEDNWYFDGVEHYTDIATLTLQVTVTDIKIKSAKAISDSLVLYKGEKTTLKVKGKKSGTSVKFISRNKKVVSVTSSGKVKAKGYGNTTIDVKVGSGCISYPVSVGPKKGVKAARWAVKKAGKAKYSQAKRMKSGYFDCSSLTGRSYATQGLTLGGSKSWSSTAAGQAKWCKTNNHVLFMNSKDIDFDQMLPGDLIFYVTGYAGVNSGYRHIDHVAIYLGNGYKAEVAKGVVSAGNWGDSSGGALMIGRPSQYAAPVPMASGLSAKKASSTSVKLTWKKKSGVTGYKILRATDDKYGTYKVVATVKGASKKSYVNKGLKKGHTYYYRIRAYKKFKGKTFLGRLQSADIYSMPVSKSVTL